MLYIVIMRHHRDDQDLYFGPFASEHDANYFGVKQSDWDWSFRVEELRSTEDVP